MDKSPLSSLKAHSFAQNASFKTKNTHIVAAGKDHSLAAGEFANARKTTTDIEALRTLLLLEKHHSDLALIADSRPKSSLPERLTPEGLPHSQPASPVMLHREPVPRESLREVGSTLANDLASARGIPLQKQTRGAETRPLLSPRQSCLTPFSDRKLDVGSQANAGSPISTGDGRSKPFATGILPSRPRLPDPDLNLSPAPKSSLPSQNVEEISTESEAAFARFYATFGNFIASLSAPLAFTGLPLGSSDPVPRKSLEKASQSHTVSKSGSNIIDHDLTRLFSRATLQSLKSDGIGQGPNESFYVVPTSGGSISYAEVLSINRQGSNVTEEEEVEFVDAYETPRAVLTNGVRASEERMLGHPKRNGKSRKTLEELNTENESLKSTLEDLGDRLKAFELGAQKSSLALHASMRAFSSPTSSVAGGRVQATPQRGPPRGIVGLEERLREVEEEVNQLQRENKKLLKENQKHVGIIERYRERWEMLKVGARERVRTG